MSTLTITGYEQNGKCDHCGRTLKHCIKLANGQIVGATCFSKKMTQPKINFGKKQHADSDTIIYFAKAVESGKMGKYGVRQEHLIFEAA